MIFPLIALYNVDRYWCSRKRGTHSFISLSIQALQCQKRKSILTWIPRTKLKCHIQLKFSSASKVGHLTLIKISRQNLLTIIALTTQYSLSDVTMIGDAN